MGCGGTKEASRCGGSKEASRKHAGPRGPMDEAFRMHYGPRYSAEGKKLLSHRLECTTSIEEAVNLRSKHVETSAITEALAQHHTILIDGQWFLDAAESGGIILSRQEMEQKFPEHVISDMKPEEILVLNPENGIINFEEISADATYFIIAVSYGWASKSHLDPNGGHLKVLAKMLKEFITMLARHGKRVAVFFDYASLYQNLPGQPRTLSQQDAFERGLTSVNVWYTHQFICKLLLSAMPSDAENTTPYDKRGWTTFEQIVSSFISSLVFDTAGIEAWKCCVEQTSMPGTGRRKELEDLPMFEKKASSSIEQLSAFANQCFSTHSSPPLTPERFAEKIQEKQFTNGKTDQDFVIQKYTETFEEVMMSSTDVSFADKGWRDDEANVFLVETLQSCPHLRKVNLRWNCFEDSALAELASHWSQLTELKLGDAGGLFRLHQSLDKPSDKPLEFITQYCTELTSLDLNQWSRISDTSLHFIAERCKKLQYLAIGNLHQIYKNGYKCSCCLSITDKGIKSIADHCEELTSLSIVSCPGITDASIENVARCCKKLTNFTIWNRCNSYGPCQPFYERITNKSIRVVADQCNDLATFTVKGYKNVSDESISLFPERCKVFGSEKKET